MTQSELPSFRDVDAALEKTSFKPHPSQVQGLICGLLCGSAEVNPDWKELVTGGKEPKATHEVLEAIHKATARQLKEFLFEFELLLPSDQSSLPDRAEALTLWTQGYLTGLKMTNIKITGREPGEVTEAINDMIEIAKMNHEEVVATEEDEEAYTELVEFVRMAVILVYQELHGDDTASKQTTSNSRLH